MPFILPLNDIIYAGLMQTPVNRLSQGFRPLLPAKNAFFMQGNDQAEGLCFLGLLENRLTVFNGLVE